MEQRAEQLDPVDDPRTRPAEVRVPVHGEDPAVADGAQRVPRRFGGERARLGHRALGVEAAWHDHDDVWIGGREVGDR